jgi:hypothetical protein
MKKTHLALISLTVLFFISFQTRATNTSIKVALILDTSNSMDGLIDQAKSQLWSVVNELSAAKCDGITPDIEIALYEYGNDRLPMREGYIRQVTPFTDDLDLISEKLFSLKTDGGSEFCGQVIGVSLNELDWEDYPKDLKMIFIAGNEPFDQGNVSYREVCKTAREKDITVNTIFCGNFEEGVQTFWKDGAYIGGGDYMNIDQDCRYVYIKSPYDDRILKLNEALNKTYIAYGSGGDAMHERQAEQDANAFSLNEEAAINRASSKSKSAYRNAQWDLVDASGEADFDIEEISTQDLPDKMKNMTTEEKKQYIADKKIEREEINQEISELSKKREKYVAEKRSEDTDNMLDQAILRAVKKQAVARNFQFVKEE